MKKGLRIALTICMVLMLLLSATGCQAEPGETNLFTEIGNWFNELWTAIANWFAQLFGMAPNEPTEPTQPTAPIDPSCTHEEAVDDDDCTTAVICTCGITVVEAKDHTPEADDGNCLTAITCSVCGTVTTPAKESHTGGTATCTEKAVCTACGTAYGAIDANNHIDENTDHICDRECGKTDIGTHSDSAEDNDHVCDYGCGVILEDHKGGEATCAAQAICEVCEASYGEINPDNHEYETNNGICCKTYQPAELNESGYYEIGNAGQLFWFAQQVNVEGNKEIKGVLTAAIDLENRPWTPIGAMGEENSFRGVFDGQNYTIWGLNVEGSENGVGFFGEVRTGTVKNFTIYGEVVVNTEVDYVGGVIGSICGLNGENDLYRNGAIIQNITSYVNVTANAHGIGMIGGFVGYADHQSLIEKCSWYGTFDAGIYHVDSGAGGFIGKIQENTSEVTIRNCAAYGTIKTNYEKNSYNNYATIYMGGFLSFSNTGAKTVLENCLFAGKFERGENLTDQAFLGAFGTLRSVNAIKNCYYLGDDGLAAVHSDSLLKPGSDNVEITKVTEDDLRNGTIAIQLGNYWEQGEHYPVIKK